jgi:Helix-turn-helix domain
MRDANSGVSILRDHEAAEYLSVSPSTLRAWRSQGRGPVWVGLSRRIGYTLVDLDAYISANRVQKAGPRNQSGV